MLAWFVPLRPIYQVLRWPFLRGMRFESIPLASWFFWDGFWLDDGWREFGKGLETLILDQHHNYAELPLAFVVLRARWLLSMTFFCRGLWFLLGLYIWLLDVIGDSANFKKGSEKQAWSGRLTYDSRRCWNGIPSGWERSWRSRV